MSVKFINRVWEHSKSKGSDLLIILAIADNANDDGHAWPGVSTGLTHKTRLTARTVGERIKKLAASGELIVYPNPGRSHDYIVTVGMTMQELKHAIKSVANKRDLTTKELSYLRKNFAGGDKAAPPKKLRTPSESYSRGGANPTSDEPSLTINEPSVPKGREAAEPAPSPSPKNSEEKSPPHKHPAVQAFRDVAHRYPPQAWYEDVARVVGEKEADVERWHSLVKDWVGNGWNPGNVKGMLDAYQNGGIKDKKAEPSHPGTIPKALHRANRLDIVDPTPEQEEQIRQAIRAAKAARKEKEQARE